MSYCGQERGPCVEFGSGNQEPGNQDMGTGLYQRARRFGAATTIEAGRKHVLFQPKLPMHIMVEEVEALGERSRCCYW